MFCKKGVFKNFTNFILNFVKFLRTPLSIEHLWWLLLYMFKVNINPFLPSIAFFKSLLFPKIKLFQSSSWTSFWKSLTWIHFCEDHFSRNSGEIFSLEVASKSRVVVSLCFLFIYFCCFCFFRGT